MTYQTQPQLLSPEVFSEIAKIAKRDTGILLGDEKKAMVQSRLKSRLKQNNLVDFSEYLKLVTSTDGESERRQMISALTTNVSHFFRENHHFDLLISTLGPTIEKKIKNDEKLRFWSAGCSTGQEAVSMCMCLLDHFPDIGDIDFKILASDIDPMVLNKAREFTYKTHDIDKIPNDKIIKYVREKNNQGEFEIVEKVRKYIFYKELNLMKEWPMRQCFDAIFCRNVMIYFHIDTQRELWPRFSNFLHENGLLFLGHSERVLEPENYALEIVGPTTYAKNAKKDTL